MKNTTSFKWLTTILLIAIASFAQDSYAQVKVRTLPDGTVIYSDGTIQRPGDVRTSRDRRTTRLPDGTIRYPDGRVKYPDGTVRFPDGRVKRPDGTILNPDGTVRNRNSRDHHRDGKRIPPGQHKKMHGNKSARDHAPGHNKHKKHDRDHDDDDRNKNWKKNKKHKKDKHDD